MLIFFLPFFFRYILCFSFVVSLLCFVFSLFPWLFLDELSFLPSHSTFFPPLNCELYVLFLFFLWLLQKF